MNNPKDEDCEEEIRKAVMRGWRNVEKMMKQEPSEIILEGYDEGEVMEQTIDDITSWLFHRRQVDDSTDS